MTAEELFAKYSEYLQGEGMLWHGYFVCKKAFLLALEEYASQQRTEGIREGFEAAREGWQLSMTEFGYAYSDVDDYLNRKQ